MGLDVSHDAWSGSCSSFNRFRAMICDAIGGSYPPHNDAARLAHPTLPEDRFIVGEGFERELWPGLWCLLEHSDCEGEIDPEMAALVADDLERILPRLEVIESTIRWRRDDAPTWCSSRARRFIDGCRRAAAAHETLLFE